MIVLLDFFSVFMVYGAGGGRGGGVSGGVGGGGRC